MLWDFFFDLLVVAHLMLDKPICLGVARSQKGYLYCKATGLRILYYPLQVDLSIHGHAGNNQIKMERRKEAIMMIAMENING